MTPSERSTKQFVIIGASTGLGRAAARGLAREHRVIVAGRDVERTRAAAPEAAEAMRVDLTSLADVRRFTDELASRGPLDGVICNAGVQKLGPPAFTPDGYEETFTVNHLAHFAIAMRLVPVLAPGARIVFVGSGTLDPDARGARRYGFRGARYTDARTLAAGVGDPDVDETQRGLDRYATSKLCNLLAMAAIARRASPDKLAAFALDPGMMPGTGLAREHSLPERIAWHTIAYALPGTSTARRSGAALAWLAAADAHAGTTGRYFDFHRLEIEPCAIARRTDWADELYATSLALAGIAADPLA